MPPQSDSKPTLEQIDPNFKAAVNSDSAGLCWIDAFDPRLALRGAGWLAETAPQRSFRRLPDRAESKMSEGVRVLSKNPAGMFLAFRTDSTHLSVRARNEDATVMPHMPLSGSSGVELYLREGPRWVPVATGIPEVGKPDFERVLVQEIFRGSQRMSEYRLYLPLYASLQELSIGVTAGSYVEPVAATTKPIFFYGTSITQGGCASTAGTDYVSHVGRLMDTEVINFGFSGSGCGEPEVAELIAEVDAEMFVLDFLPNCKPEWLVDRLPRFVEILRAAHPTTPIVLMTHPGYDGSLIGRARYRGIYDKRDIAFAFYCKHRPNDPHFHLIDGFGLAPAGVAGTYVDGVHPTSGGFIQMAERLVPQLHAVRLWDQVL